MTSNDEYVLKILLECGKVTPEQADAARASAGHEGMTPVDVLIDEAVLTEPEILAAVADHLGMEVISLKGIDIPADVRETIPLEVARRYKVVPVYRNENGITVAISDPLDFDSLDSLRYLLKVPIEAVVASRQDVKAALDRYYPVESNIETMALPIGEGGVDVTVTTGADMGQEGTVTETDAPIIKLVHMHILEAFRNRASDIHLEPMEKRFRVRYRIDGVLHEVDSPPKRLQSAIISRVKIMANMKISEKRLPQDGRIQVSIMGRELDLRVSTVPGSHGESVVMRILDKQNLALGLPQLGFFADDQQTFERLLSLSDGIILVTGPTGSGKTTTLYACLQEMNRPDRKIITVEDPVEYQISGINQVQVREDINLTFANALRAILRQAPNIVMIGEIRDYETAMIATEASLTGHLVFSTLHTNDAPSAVTRLLDIGVKPFLVASSLRAAMAQRLIRTICEKCKEEYVANPTELRFLRLPEAQEGDVKLWRGRGCNHCVLTGYRGRKGIFEIFKVTEDIQRMIFEKLPAHELRERAREHGMRTLREDGMRKVLAGITTVEEVMRVTLGDED